MNLKGVQKKYGHHTRCAAQYPYKQKLVYSDASAQDKTVTSIFCFKPSRTIS